ncbi:Mobile element protein [Thioalkalivibrio nitratireducens DSM 14787]|uniref:Integrase catalytic region n=1 Tax=Thioalkalivibrio nitratireducens (strain DSM 14787 / UNIQEM 213 / ALEN2) TaxID=1255043 RepID=L0DQQ4_THIND|nr:IS481-like element ISTni2 family transposase [Thioalkalivibrio nitratireducens]AGA31834.1 Integrase catalytic region [Thioalkalivibrio nitratireducens DSM 14787]AGA32475.1 integrase catalytic subunit [Thioalkalivibrio nitratireducens DSM 14787]AGA34917.1 Mobile element protein [Thioalkalivibrio nitratireducens DSM 14787]
MTTGNDPRHRDRWARLRFSIIGPLFAAPPQPGALQAALAALAERDWRHPVTGGPVRFGVSTLERWYYAARAATDPVAALRNRRRPKGHFMALTPVVIETLVQQYREHPGWTAQLHFDNLCAAFAGCTEGMPSYATVRRYLKAHGMHRQARPRRDTEGAERARDRFERLEVRSYELEHVAALWHLDFHHGSRKVLTRDGTWAKPYLLGILDDRSRLICHLQWYLDESAQGLVHGLSQAFMKRGLPRALMTDNGAAMLAEETVAGLQRLGVLHQTTLPYSPHQNGKQESLWGRIEGRLLPMLEGHTPLTLEVLNQATQAWAEQEYHRTHHSELGTTPLQRYLAGPNVRRDCPPVAALADAFRIEVTRRQRRSDGTVSLDGQRFEIPARYQHLDRVHLRYARWDRSRVDLVDPHTGTLLCPVLPLDKSAHAHGQRRTRPPATPPLDPLPPSGMAPLLRQLLADYAATGLPPAYLPIPEEDDA